MYDILDNEIADARYLFHYTKTSHLLESILPESKLRFSSLETTNDPLEFENFNHFVVSKSEVTNLETSTLIDEGFKLIDIIKKVCKICCFSIDCQPNYDRYLRLINKGYCLPRMWSQYGENHYGACLVFDRIEIESEIRNSKKLLISENGEYQFFNREIIYDDSLPGLEAALTLEYESVKGKQAIQLFENNLIPFLFTKFENYKHEQEYRMVIYNDTFLDRSYIDVDYGKSLKAIILGCRFKSTYLPSLKYFTENQDIPILQLQWYNGSPSLIEK